MINQPTGKNLILLTVLYTCLVKPESGFVLHQYEFYQANSTIDYANSEYNSERISEIIRLLFCFRIRIPIYFSEITLIISY